MPLSRGILVLLPFIAGVEKVSWGVWVSVKGQGYHLQGPEIQKFTFGHFTHTLISVAEEDFKLNVQDQRSLRF